MKVIITGSTGMVGEGVLLECLSNPNVKETLIVNRRPYEGKRNPKLKELIVSDFLHLEEVKEQLKGYNACFYCAGKSSVGMNEQDYTRITYDTVMYFAKTLLPLNPDMTFCHVSGTSTDSTEKGKVMWARIKGKAENDLMKLSFKAVYNFRPALMKPSAGQKYLNGYNKMYPILYPVLCLLMPDKACTIQKIGQAMINSVLKGYPKHVLEVKDIKLLAKENKSDYFMIINKSHIKIKPIQNEDIPLFGKWLNKEYICKWLCPSGERDREAWLDQVNDRNGTYDFIKHYIVYHNDRKIGYCLHADCFYLKDLEEEGHDFENLYGDVTGKNHTYEIGYLIGEEEYLKKGIGKQIIQLLEEKIIELGGCEIAADPSENNIFSVKALLSNGFKKKKDGDYRKRITIKIIEQ